MTDSANLTVADNPDASRYEVTDGSGVVAGFVDYQVRDGVLNLTHTEVDPAFEGQGVGSTLARGTLDDLRSHGRPVQASCSFIRGYVDKHPEYQDVLTG